MNKVPGRLDLGRAVSALMARDAVCRWCQQALAFVAVQRDGETTSRMVAAVCTDCDAISAMRG